jgi:equilibrative nucleoside transporter 1/2/3
MFIYLFKRDHSRFFKRPDRAVSPMCDGDDLASPLLESVEIGEGPPTEPIHIDHEPNHENLFFLLGTASFMGFDTICNAIDIFRDISGRPDIATTLTRAYNFPCATISLFLLLFRPRNLRVTILVSLSFLVLTTSLFTALVTVSPERELTMILILAAVSGFFSSILYSTTSSFLSQFTMSADILNANGIGCSGVLACGIRIMTKAAFTEESEKSMGSVSYFCLNAAIILGILIYAVCKLRQECLSEKLELPKGGAVAMFPRTTLEIVKVIWPQWCAVFLDYAITLSMYPGFLTDVKEVPEIGDWTPVIVTTLHCVFDWLGRHLPTRYRWFSKKTWMLIGTRVFFYPIFVLSIRGIVDLGDPMWTFVWLIPFAFTHGYVGTVSMAHGSNPDGMEDQIKESAALLMSLAVGLGTLAGMGLTWAVVA